MKNIKESTKVMTFVIGDGQLSLRQWVNCLLLLLFINSCTVSKQISKQANSILLNDTAISTGHIGISVGNLTAGQYTIRLVYGTHVCYASFQKL